DPAHDAFVFPGYERTVTLRASSEEFADGVIATVADTYGPAPFDATLDITTRFKRYLQAGRVKEVTTLSGRLGTDPWSVGIGDLSSNYFRKSGAHYDWQVRVLTSGPTPTPNERCIDIDPYVNATGQASGAADWEDECTKRGFIIERTVTTWRGEPGSADPY